MSEGPTPLRYDPASFCVVGLIATNIRNPGDWQEFSNQIHSIAIQSVKLGFLGISVYMDPELYPNGRELLTETVFAIAHRLALDGNVRALMQKSEKLPVHQYQEMIARVPGWLSHDQALIERTWVMFGAPRGVWHYLRVEFYSTSIGMTRPGMPLADYEFSTVCPLECTLFPSSLEPGIYLDFEDVDRMVADGTILCMMGERERHHLWLSEIHDLAVPLWLLQRFFNDAPGERQWLIENNELCDSHLGLWLRTYESERYKTLFPETSHWLIGWAPRSRINAESRREKHTPVTAINLISEEEARHHAELVAQMWEVDDWQQIAVNIRKAQVSLLGEEGSERYMKICADTVVDRAKARKKFIDARAKMMVK